MGGKTAGIYVLLIAMFTGMLCRLYALGQGSMLSEAASTQTAFLLDVAQTRGIIYDCNLKPLVSTEKRVVAAVQPSPEAAIALSEAAGKDGEEISYDPEAQVPYLLQLKEETLYAKGIEMFEIDNRYAEEQLAPHIIGYLNPDKTSGSAGIELAYDEILTQHAGALRLRYTMDALGNTMQVEAPEIIQDNYRDSGGVVLTLDAEIQKAAEKAMASVEKGAAVVMDVNTGDIKASVSVPAYNPNDLASSLKDPDSPFVNRVFSQYNVGSTFKLITAAAALENGFGRYTPYVCEGYEDVKGQIFYCHWRSGHGELDMERAIKVSCNPYFIHLGQIAGGGRITALARAIGFSRATRFSDDLVTSNGTLPSESELENPAALANLSFGQGSLTATPIQVAQMICAVANGGYAVQPRLTEGFTDDGQTIYEHTPVYAKNQVFSARTAEILQEYLVANVQDGSGKLAKPSRGMAGGKTASAQTGIYLTPGDEDSEIVHAWFAGFYPEKTPKYAIVVIVEGGNSGSDVAAPIFKQIADGIWLSEL